MRPFEPGATAGTRPPAGGHTVCDEASCSTAPTRGSVAVGVHRDRARCTRCGRPAGGAARRAGWGPRSLGSVRGSPRRDRAPCRATIRRPPGVACADAGDVRGCGLSCADRGRGRPGCRRAVGGAAVGRWCRGAGAGAGRGHGCRHGCSSARRGGVGLAPPALRAAGQPRPRGARRRPAGPRDSGAVGALNPACVSNPRVNREQLLGTVSGHNNTR
ncbi:MAG: hypothetical protein ACI970_000016 [Myxococcota bacterium]|jgi:hypothetical protein